MGSERSCGAAIMQCRASKKGNDVITLNISDHYWKSDDPLVLDALEDRRTAARAWDDCVDAFRREYDVCPQWEKGECVGVLGSSPRLPGKWTKPSNSFDISRPHLSNKEGQSLLARLARPPFEARYCNGLLNVAVFDGVAYARSRSGADIHPLWQPARSWEWVRAQEEGSV